MRTARAMGIATVAVYSDADADSPHVRRGRRGRAAARRRAGRHLPALAPSSSTPPPGPAPTPSTPATGSCPSRATSPGWWPGAGFLWVGPPPAAIDAMGSKIGAKELMRAAGVPTLPVRHRRRRRRPSRPAPTRSSASGGRCWSRPRPAAAAGACASWAARSSCAEAVAGARREAEAAFGDGTVFLERYVTDPRHIEVQILADAHGAPWPCSSGSAPSSAATRRSSRRRRPRWSRPALRARLGEAAVAAARAVGYVNAGTVEFVLDDATGEFYFLEMNTRLQVEHPVTEAVTGLDLVRLQLLVAGGVPTARRGGRRRGPRPAGPRHRGPPLRRGPGRRLAALHRHPPPLRGRQAVSEQLDRPCPSTAPPSRQRGPGGQRGGVGQRGQPPLRPHAGQGHRPRPHPPRGRRHPGRHPGPGPHPRGHHQPRPAGPHPAPRRRSWPARPTPASSTATA